jgi:hypothetical protein
VDPLSGNDCGVKGQSRALRVGVIPSPSYHEPQSAKSAVMRIAAFRLFILAETTATVIYHNQI